MRSYVTGSRVLVSFKGTATQKLLKVQFGIDKMSVDKSEYQFLMGHLTRKTYQVEFVKCVSSQCDHCAKTPIRAVNFFNFIKQHGGVVPFPESSTVYRGHYSTLLQHLKMPLVCDFEECLPSLKGGSQPACAKDNCRYVFNSKADAKRHKNK